MTLHAENTSCARHACAAAPVVAHWRGPLPGGSPTLRREQRARSCLQPTAWAGAPAAEVRCTRRHQGTGPGRWHQETRLGSPRPCSSPAGHPFLAEEKLRVCSPRRAPRRELPAEPRTSRPRPDPGRTGQGWLRGAGRCREFVRSPPGWCPPPRRAPPSPGRARRRGHSPGRGWAAAEGPRTSTQPASSPLKLPPRCLRCLFVPSRT